MEKPFAVQGQLYVQKPRRSWKKKWCEIRDESFIMNSIDSKKVTDQFSVGQIATVEQSQTGRNISESSRPPFVFLVTFADNISRFYFGTFSKETLEKWMEALQKFRKYYFNQYRIRKKMESSLTWMKTRISDDDIPTARYNHTLTEPLVCEAKKRGFLRQSSAGRQKRACSMWMFGGKNEKDEFLYDLRELHFPNADENEGQWIVINGQGKCASGRSGHTVIVYGKYLFLFGGESKYGLCNDLHTFHTQTHLWSQPMYEGQAPSARHGHTATSLGNMMYIIGGKSDKYSCEDIFALNLDLLRWDKFDSKNWTSYPGALFGHSTIAVGSNLLFVFGGENDEGFNGDLWIFDLYLHIWTRPSVRGTPPEARKEHVASLVGHNMFISGGRNETQIFDDVYYLCTQTLVWYYSTITGDHPAPRWGHCASEINSTQFSYGGCKQSKSLSSSIYALATKPLEQQWHDSITGNVVFTCSECNNEVLESSLYVELISSPVVFHEECLQKRMVKASKENRSGIGEIIPASTTGSDLQFLLEFVRKMISSVDHPLHMNLVKFSREFNAEYSEVEASMVNETYESAVEEVSVYLDCFTKMVIRNIKLLDSPEGIEQCSILIKQTLLPLIYISLFGIFKMRYNNEDEILAESIRAHKDSPIESFALTSDIILGNDAENEPYQYAIDTVNELSKFKDPFQKVDELVLMRHSIHCCIDKYYENMKKKVILSADDLVSLYQYIIIKSEAKCFYSEIQFIRVFLGDSFNNGEIDYCLTTFEVSISAMKFISSTPTGDVVTTT